MGTSSSVSKRQGRNDGVAATTLSPSNQNNESAGSDSDNRVATGQDSSLDGTPSTERKWVGSRTVGSFNKRKSGSMRKGSMRAWHRNTELEAEIDKLKRELEEYRLKKECEFEELSDAKERSINEVRRLKGEIRLMRDTCAKLRSERDNAINSEEQAIARATTFQQERDKIQRQFKLYRETKESELQELLKAKKELEGKLFKHQSTDNINTTALTRENSAKTELRTLGGISNASNTPLVTDWSTSLESSWSINWAGLYTDKGAESAQVGDLNSPYFNVNKDDWKAASMALAKSIPPSMQIAPINTLKVYVSAPKGLEKEVDVLNQMYTSRLEDMCQRYGCHFLLIHLPYDGATMTKGEFERAVHTRKSLIRDSGIFLAFLGESANRFTQMEFDNGHLRCTGSRPAIFCFRNIAWDQQFSVKADAFRGYSAKQLKVMIRNNKNAKAIDNYSSPEDGAELAFKELRKTVKMILGIEEDQIYTNSNGDSDSAVIANSEDVSTEGEDILDTNREWDINGEAEQLEAFRNASETSGVFGLSECANLITEKISVEGPCPPLLVIGDAGSGKSLISAKWIEEYQKANADCIILYHFVGLSSSTSADPLVTLKRFTSQLMRHTRQRNQPTNDPSKLEEEFLANLEKIYTEHNGRVVIFLDSADRFRSCETQLKWLLDPLPAEVRVILTCKGSTIPQAWRPWPTVYIPKMDEDQCKLLLKSLTDNVITFADDQEDAIVTKATEFPSCPIFIHFIAKELTSKYDMNNLDAEIDACLACEDTVELCCYILSQIEKEYEPQDEKGIVRKILSSIYASRNGLTEGECLKLASIGWKTWGPIIVALKERKIVIEKCGVLSFPFQLVRDAVKSKYMSDKMHGVIDVTATIRKHLIYFHSSLIPTDAKTITYRMADELPWLTYRIQDTEKLRDCLLDLNIFLKLYKRGRFSDILDYWYFIGVTKSNIISAYINKVKSIDDDNGPTLYTANLYEALGRFSIDLNLCSQGVQPLQRSLEIKETVLDPDHSSIAQTLHHLAVLYSTWGKYRNAFDLHKQALEIYEINYGKDHSIVAKELEAMGYLCQKQEKHQMADAMFIKAQSILNKVPSPTDTNFVNAEILRRKAVQIEELALNEESAEVANTLNELGVLYFLQSNLQVAESYFKRSLTMRESVLGKDHADVAQSLNNLAALYCEKKMYSQAETLYAKALRIRAKLFSNDHPHVASVIKHLGATYRKQGKLDDAEPLYRQTVEIREKLFGLRHPSTATALSSLAILLCEEEKHAEALPLYERALDIYEESLGSMHPCVAETLKNMAVLRYNLGEYAAAAQLYKRAIELRESRQNEQGMYRATSRRSSDGELSINSMKGGKAFSLTTVDGQE